MCASLETGNTRNRGSCHRAWLVAFSNSRQLRSGNVGSSSGRCQRLCRALDRMSGLRGGRRRQAEGWRRRHWVEHRHGRRGQGKLRGRGRRGRSRSTFVGADAAAGRAVRASRAAVLRATATVADDPAVAAAIREPAADLGAADGLDAEVVSAGAPASRTRAGTRKPATTAVADGSAVLLS